MEPADYIAKIQELEKANRILAKKLARVEAQAWDLDATNQRKEALLRQALQEVKASQLQLAELNESLEQRVEQRTTELSQALYHLQQVQLQMIQSEKMSALGELVAGIAHEINNPIGFIAGNLIELERAIQDLLAHLELYHRLLPNAHPQIQTHAEDIELEYLIEDLPKIINSMGVGCDRIKSLSTSLRTFSRADRVDRAEADIHAGLDSTLMILQHRLKPNDHRPAIQVSKQYGELPRIYCFLGQLNQVFMNLLSNAIDAMEESNLGRSYEEIKASPNQIQIHTGVAQQQIVIRIRDNGVGMPEDVRLRIFDQLFTTKEVGKGTGLGLAISRQIIVEKHNGVLEVSSHPGQGSEFTIRLPLLTEAMEMVGANSGSPKAQAGETS